MVRSIDSIIWNKVYYKMSDVLWNKLWNSLGNQVRVQVEETHDKVIEIIK